MLVGSVPGDRNYTTAEQILDRLGTMADNRSLNDVQDFATTWLNRIARGDHDLGDARTAATELAQTGHVDVSDDVGAPSGASEDDAITPGAQADDPAVEERPQDDHGFATTDRGLSFAPDSHWSELRVHPTVQMVYDTNTTAEERLAIFQQAAEGFAGGAAAFEDLAPRTQRAYALRVAHNELLGPELSPGRVRQDHMERARHELQQAQDAGDVTRLGSDPTDRRT